MDNPNNYDPYELLPSPEPHAIHQIHNAATPFGLNPFNNDSSGSPLQPIAGFDSGSIDVISIEEPYDKLRIIAEPKTFYRGRYLSDIHLNRHETHLIRAEENEGRYEYPTIEIPRKWRDPTRQLYIRVTLITVQNENVPISYIHPYRIDTNEDNVMKDPLNNCIYFRITDNELLTGAKSFHIILIKSKQGELISHGRLRLLDSNQYQIFPTDNLHNARQIIETYQLWHSKFHFTIAERHGIDSLPIPILQTSIKSQTMNDADSAMNNINGATNNNQGTIRFAPEKGDWFGNDNVIIMIPNFDKQKVFDIYFDFGAFGLILVTQTTVIDERTLLFRTPLCPILPHNENIRIPFIIIQDDLVIAQIQFIYLAPIITNNICSNCQLFMPSLNMNGQADSDIEVHFEPGSAAHLTSEMSPFSIQQTKNESCPETSSTTLSQTTQSDLDTYLNYLKKALADFVRTNNPSRLFRLTRLLLAKCDESSPPLNDAIQLGHTQLALTLIEQVIKMPSANGLLEKGNEDDETPLLIAAKMNQWKLIQTILEKRSDLAQQKDKNGNNLLHLLASLSEDRDAETLKNVLEILPNDVKTKLVNEKNKSNETPMDIARSHGNFQYIDQ